jgi:hypothetical protein
MGWPDSFRTRCRGGLIAGGTAGWSRRGHWQQVPASKRLPADLLRTQTPSSDWRDDLVRVARTCSVRGALFHSPNSEIPALHLGQTRPCPRNGESAVGQLRLPEDCAERIARSFSVKTGETSRQ